MSAAGDKVYQTDDQTGEKVDDAEGWAWKERNTLAGAGAAAGGGAAAARQRVSAIMPSISLSIYVFESHSAHYCFFFFDTEEQPAVFTVHFACFRLLLLRAT
jgi:hypothetical protein